MQNLGQEKNFENRVKKFLKNSGCWFIKYWSGKSATGQTFTKTGIPDILCCCNGCFLGIEVKAPHGEPSQLQLWNLKEIDQAGGYAILLYPEDYGDFMFMVTNLQNGYFHTANEYYKELKGRWST